MLNALSAYRKQVPRKSRMQPSQEVRGYRHQTCGIPRLEFECGKLEVAVRA